MAGVIENTGWTIDQYDASPRERVNEMLVAWQKMGALREVARELNR